MGPCRVPRQPRHTVQLLCEAGPAVVPIEDDDRSTGHIESLTVATERVAVAADAARLYDAVLTARAENHQYGVDHLDDTR